MKFRVIAVLLVLLLLAVSLVTGVFADPGSEDTTAATDAETVTENTEAAVTEPPATEPPATEPPVTEPVVTVPFVTEPVVTEPAVTEPVVTEPVVTEPVTTEPVETEPAATEPVETTPEETEPEETEPPEQKEALCSLTVRLEEALPEQDMLFTVEGDGLNLQLVIPAGKTSVTVSGLQTGTYTVTEERSWSWRYDTEVQEDALRKSVTFDSWQTEASVSYRPEETEFAWLGDCARGDGT